MEFENIVKAIAQEEKRDGCMMSHNDSITLNKCNFIKRLYNFFPTSNVLLGNK